MSDNVLNTPGLMDPSTEFGNMMQTAMKIKGHQMEQDRRKFETFPTFLQNTMWMQGRPVELRELPIAERLPEATKFKEEGNELFRKKAYAGAIEQYEAALGAFRYAKQLDPDWKKKGIKDETIDLIQDDGEVRDAPNSPALVRPPRAPARPRSRAPRARHAAPSAPLAHRAAPPVHALTARHGRGG